jgi:HEAT repeats
MTMGMNQILETLKELKERPSNSVDYYDDIWRKAHGLAEAHYVPAKELFIQGLNDADWQWRGDCIRFLGFHYSPLESTVLEKIRELLIKDPEADVRIAAASVLGGRSSLPDNALLIALNSDSNWWVRISAFESLLELAGISYKIRSQELERVNSGEIKPSIEEVKRILASKNMGLSGYLEEEPDKQ